MRKTFIVLLLLLTIGQVFSTDPCTSDKVFKTDSCITNEACCSGGGYLSINGPYRQCIEKCPQTQYVVTSGSLKTCTTCPDDNPIPNQDQTGCGLCSGFYTSYISDIRSHTCLSDKKYCYGLIQSDERRCGLSCQPQEFELSRKTYRQCYFRCSKYVEIFDWRESRCTDECTDEEIIYTEYNVCYSTPRLCPASISVGGKYCVDSCDETKREFSLLLSGLGFEQCTICEQLNFFTPSSKTNRVSTCSKKCAEGTISDYTKQTCISSPTECKGYISADGKTCKSECKRNMKEYVQQFPDYNKCQVCTDFYTDNEDFTKTTCKPKCDSDQLTLIRTSECVSKADGCGQGLVLSPDKTTCDIQCYYPYIQQGSVCIDEASCSGENQIIDYTQSKTTCSSTVDGYSCSLKSSDGKRCVKTCLSIKEADPVDGSKICRKCEQLKLFITNPGASQAISGCKESLTISEWKSLIFSYIDHTGRYLPAMQNIESTKEFITDYLELAAGAITSTSDNSEILVQIQLVVEQFLALIVAHNEFKSMLNKPHTLGSNEHVKGVAQLVKKGNQFKQSFNLKTMQEDTISDLTEENPDNSRSLAVVIYLAIKNNPGCKHANCQDYPAIVMQQMSTFSPNRRMLPEITIFSVDFPVTQASQNYVCLTYNLKTNQVSTNSSATVSPDGTTARCTLSDTDSTSLYLDITCLYLDPQKCPSSNDKINNSNNNNNNNSNKIVENNTDDGLSTGGIIGIVIGSIAFALIVGVNFSYFLYKYLLRKRRSLPVYDEPKRIETAETVV